VTVRKMGLLRTVQAASDDDCVGQLLRCVSA
jgi:hypothetical protein